MDKNADFLLLKITKFYSKLLDRIIFFLLTIWLKIFPFIEFIIYIFEVEFYITFFPSLNKNIILIIIT